MTREALSEREIRVSYEFSLDVFLFLPSLISFICFLLFILSVRKRRKKRATFDQGKKCL